MEVDEPVAVKVIDLKK
jgi:serine/threonine protein kinase